MGCDYNSLKYISPLAGYQNYNGISGEETKPMEKVTLTNEEYAQLIEARRNLELIKKFAEAENHTYGYGSATSAIIDGILGIERNK